MEPTGVQRGHCLGSRYADVVVEIGDIPTPPMEAFPERPTGRSDRHVEITGGGHILEGELEDSDDCYILADVMRNHVKCLHVHDASISGSMTRERGWGPLKWCRVERCPNFEDSLFPLHTYGFDELEVVWVSELAMACCLWSKRVSSRFESLRHLRLRSCPRLQYALPLLKHNSLRNLETIHVVRCGDLRHIFVLFEHDPYNIASTGIKFPMPTTIHLYDLPSLREIFEVKVFAPKLEAVKIRGCFNLRRLPAPVEESQGVRLTKPIVEVEKDVWDALEWDEEDVGHHPSYYEPPVHSRHYRQSRLLRRSVLR